MSLESHLQQMIPRIEAAIQRIISGQGLMRIPAEDTDPDIVLGDLLQLIPKPNHNWNDVGEKCLTCGDPDWVAGPYCNGRIYHIPGPDGDLPCGEAIAKAWDAREAEFDKLLVRARG